MSMETEQRPAVLSGLKTQPMTLTAPGNFTAPSNIAPFPGMNGSGNARLPAHRYGRPGCATRRRLDKTHTFTSAHPQSRGPTVLTGIRCEGQESRRQCWCRQNRRSINGLFRQLQEYRGQYLCLMGTKRTGKIIVLIAISHSSYY